ncbi:MAG: ATPase [Anaerolineae bacterium]|nr:ATPase [Anaerolineae bacterium]
MDILHLVDRLEDLIDEGRHIPLSKYTMIDEERALEIIDQMRISIPEEIEKANRVLQQRDRLMAQANEEAARLVELARERGDSLISREAIAQAAQSRAANILEQARQEAEAIQADADKYVMDVLSELESQLIRTLTVVRNGINTVNQRQAASRQAPAEASPEAPVQPSVAVSAEQAAN